MPSPKSPPATRRSAATAGKPSQPEPTPSERLDALGVDWLCDQIVEGKSLTAIAKEQGMHHATLLRWVAAEDERQRLVREARIASAQAFDEMALQGILKAKTKIAIAVAKEAAHHLRWRASKINPADYGEKVQTELTGPGGGPVQVTDPARPRITREEWLAAHGVKL